MSIPYTIVETKVRNRPVCVGQVRCYGTVDTGGLVEKLAAMGTSVPRGEIRTVLELLVKAVHELSVEGYRVKIDGLVQFSPAVGGTFEHWGDTFKKGRNTLYVVAHVPAGASDLVPRGGRPKLVRTDHPAPFFRTLTHPGQKTLPGVLVSGEVVSVKGKGLKFDSRGSEEMLFLVNDLNQTDKIQVTRFLKVTDRELMFLLPGAIFGTGHFELRSLMRTTTLRTGRSGSFTILTPPETPT